ncbi:TetR/AcrR family transcriptional regulator [Cellulomonas xylanilytica]|uniref:TetR family transcriptional regulator n=1 Tax=Cellulomonas xylanilytica TaxID=233583 RepID=A0A510V296_9CELL|nr:TetR/AcrR family transcriptional regulator [Cellulomonas xylanilytica]GEK21017.1 TetR family transcriptional regulator [Cellulomonas xylanilytica]
MPSAPTPPSSRAADTRRSLQTHALHLFEEQGYEQTTVAEIAKAAGVSHMTFFRNFPTKEDVVLDDPYDPMLAEAVAAQPRDLVPLERVRLGLLSALAGLQSAEFDEESRRRLRLATGVPALRARIWESMTRTQDAVVTVLVAQDVERSVAEASVGAVLGAMTSGLMHWGAAQPATDGPMLADALATALDVLGPPR